MNVVRPGSKLLIHVLRHFWSALDLQVALFTICFIFKKIYLIVKFILVNLRAWHGWTASTRHQLNHIQYAFFLPFSVTQGIGCYINWCGQSPGEWSKFSLQYIIDLDESVLAKKLEKLGIQHVRAKQMKQAAEQIYTRHQGKIPQEKRIYVTFLVLGKKLHS